MKAATKTNNLLEFITTLLIFSFLTFMAYSAEKKILNNTGKANDVKKVLPQ